jgi:hypothetical protein
MSGSVKPEQILQDVPENFEKFDESWEGTYRDKFTNVLQKSDSETLDYIAEIAGVDQEDTGSFFEDIKRNRELSVLLYTIYRFVGGKKLSIRSFGDRNDEDVVSGTEYRYVLKEISEDNLDILYQIYLFNQWTKSSDVYVYALQGEEELPDDYLDRLREEIDSLARRLEFRTRSDEVTHDDRDQLVFDDGAIVAFNRQTSDRASRDLTGRQRRRNMQSVFVEVDEEEERIRIGTTNTNIRETLRELLQDLFNTFLVDLETEVTPDDVDTDSFREEFLRELDEADETRILTAEFRRTDTTPPLPISFSKKTYSRDIRPVLQRFDSDGLNVNLSNLSETWVQVGDYEAKINAERSIEAGFFRLDADINTQLRRRENEFRNKFHDSFGVPVNKKIPLHWVTGNRQAFIAALLKNPSSYDSRQFPNQDLTGRLANELSVVNVIERIQSKCRDCGNHYRGEIDECSSCGGEVRVVARYNVPRVSKPGIRKLIREIIKDEGFEYIGKRTERIYQTEYEFVRIQSDGTDIDLLLNTGDIKLTDKAVEHLKKSLNPVLIVNPGDVKGQSLMDEALTATLDLAELIDLKLDEELPEDYVSTKVEELEKSVEERAAKNARSAFSRLGEMVESPGEFRGEQFEQELFHIINQIISNTEQWGSKRSGNVPDGFAELYFPTGQGDYYRSLAYDAKFTESDELHLPTDETVRIRDYVKRINESGEVTGTDVELSHFVIVSNADTGNMNVIAGRLNRMHSWDGYPVFMHIGFPLALHLAYNQNFDLIKQNWSTFTEQLYRILNGGKLYKSELDEEEYIELRANDVETLMTNFEKEIEDESINITELRQFLEEDIMP